MALAAIGKALDIEGFARSLRSLVPIKGLPARPATLLLIIAEATSAIAIWFVPRYGLVASGILLLLAAATTARALLVDDGRGVACQCFGSLVSSRQISWLTTSLAAAVGAAALWAASAVPGSSPAWEWMDWNGQLLGLMLCVIQIQLHELELIVRSMFRAAST